MDKEEMIKILRNMAAHAYKMAESFYESGDYCMANRYKGEALGYYNNILLLEDKGFYNNTKRLFLKGEDEDE